MKVVTFIGDTHLFHMTPSSRKDDYPNIVLGKLCKVREESPSDAYIFTGDLTHKPNLPLKYIVKSIRSLIDCLGDNIYSIVGNHDIPREKHDKLDETTLGLLFNSKVIKPLDSVKFKVGDVQYQIIGQDYGQPLVKGLDTILFENKVFVSHSFYEHCGVPTDEAVSTDEELAKTECGHIVLGHDHAKYEISINPQGQYIYRPGSLSRGTAHNYNLEREVSVLRMEFTDCVRAFYVNIPTDPVKVAFKRKVLDEKVPKGKDMVKFINSFFKIEADNIDPFEILDNVVIEDEKIRNYLGKLFLNYGFVRKRS